MQIFAFAEL